jgi:FF domain
MVGMKRNGSGNSGKFGFLGYGSNVRTCRLTRGISRNYLKELGEIKKNERKKAEEAFVVMLKESKVVRAAGSGATQKKWSEVKKEFQKDPRYDAVGSSTLREELYETFLKSLKETTMERVEEGSTSSKTVGQREEGGVDGSPLAKRVADDEKRRRREKAVRDREERVRLEKERTAMENARSRAGLNLEEAELAFK